MESKKIIAKAPAAATKEEEKEIVKVMFYKENKPNGHFSNFYGSPIDIDGVVWPTTEHYFQAMKFPADPAH